LAFERAARGEEDIFMVIVHILCPIRQPSHGIVMLNLPPLSRDIRSGDCCTLPKVEGDVFRTNPFLEQNVNGLILAKH
jgi:hypothetical protein